MWKKISPLAEKNGTPYLQLHKQDHFCSFDFVKVRRNEFRHKNRRSILRKFPNGRPFPIRRKIRPRAKGTKYPFVAELRFDEFAKSGELAEINRDRDR